MPVRESTIVNRICENLKRRGIYFEKTHGDAMARRGRPDLMVFRQFNFDEHKVVGVVHLYFFEVKRPGGKPSPLQVHRLSELRAAGAVAEVVTSWEQVAQYMGLN